MKIKSESQREKMQRKPRKEAKQNKTPRATVRGKKYFNTQIGRAEDEQTVMAKNDVDGKCQQSATKCQ